MKIKAPETHDLAQLMDALTAADLLESGQPLTYDKDDPTVLIVPAREGVKEADVRKVLQSHKPAERTPPRSRKQLLEDFKTAPANKKDAALAALLESLV